MSHNISTDEKASTIRSDDHTEKINNDPEIGAPPQAHTTAATATRVDAALEQKVRRKLDWHVVPLVSALYLFAFLDRSNIG